MKRPRTLSARWTRRDIPEPGIIADVPGDVLYERGDGIPKVDGHLLHYAFSCGRREYNSTTQLFEIGKSFLEELHARGYDLTTLKFSIKLLPSSGATP